MASALLAFTLALAGPLALPHAPLGVDLVLVALATLLPIAVRMLVPRRPRPGHSAIERAVWWLDGRELACTNPRFAAVLAQSNGVDARASRLLEPRLAPWLVAGPILAFVVAPAGWLLHHPLVRVVNLSETRLIVRVDGRVVASVEPTSTESPAAGLELRVPTGSRKLSAEAPDGSVISSARVELRSGGRHLYAPGSAGSCFWLEETRYGRAANGPGEILPLTGSDRFWVLERHVDSWFSPNPPPPLADQRSSGGALWALRQAPCGQAPRAAPEP